MKITGDIGVTRSSDEFYYIRLRDEASCANFLEIKMTAKQFAEAVTGLHISNVEMEVRGLENVGKKRVRETRTVVCPHKTHDKEPLQTWLLNNCQEEGWTIDLYLGSQSSIKSVDGGMQLNYAVYKYVEVSE